MNADYAYEILTNKYGVNIDEDTKKALLDTVKTNSGLACAYTRNAIKGRWLEAEEYIKNDVYAAYCYAEFVIKGRWTEAEDVIKTSPWYACRYAENVIKGRWLEAEDIIETQDLSAYYYARGVVKDKDFWAKRKMHKIVENFKNNLKTVPENPELENLKKQRNELDLKIKQLESV